MPPVQEPSPGKYLYCIIRCPEPREFVTRGIGEQGAIVHTINYKDLAVVVSSSPVIEYDNSRRNMMAHSAVLDEVMQRAHHPPGALRHRRAETRRRSASRCSSAATPSSTSSCSRWRARSSWA